MNIVFTEHALFEMKRREIAKEHIQAAIENPEQLIDEYSGRLCFQNKYFDEIENNEMILRVIAEKSKDDYVIITAYKTSKIKKYWKQEKKDESHLW